MLRLFPMLVEGLFLLAGGGLIQVLFQIPYYKAGPFSLIILGALGFSLISIIQGYMHLVSRLELPFGQFVIRLFVRRHLPKVQKAPVFQRYTRR